LAEPREFAQEVDDLWIGSWEQTVGPREPAESPNEIAPTPFAELAGSYERGVPGDAATLDLTLLAAPDVTTQVRTIVLQAVDYLKRDSCARLGIVFPEVNAVALGVAEELRRLGIPLDDGAGSFMPGIFERCTWLDWLALQDEASVERLLAWVCACEAEHVSFSGDSDLKARKVARILDSAQGESLVDDLDFLARILEAKTGEADCVAVAGFLRQRIVLPAQATFSEFLDATRRALDLRGWEQHFARLENEPAAWLKKSKGPFSRRIFLEWLREATNSQTLTRGAEGNHFYGRVHLLIYAQMTGQTWSHLILTGLNEGVWPRVHEAGAFGSRHELIALNRQARALNQRATEQGSQGEGHETVRAGRGHCLLPLEGQDLALRDLCASLEATSEAVCLAALTTEDGRGLLPSDFFNFVHQAKTGRVLDEETFRALAAATSAWCETHALLFQETAPGRALPAIEATRAAYKARRDEMQPFGPCEFAFAQPPAEPIQLSCKRWEDAWNHPATVWLEDVVGAGSWPEGTLNWPRASGTWVHRWLALALRACRERGSAAELPVLVWAAADNEARRVREHAQAAGIALYPWWEQVWGQARTIAGLLGETLAPILAGKEFHAEFTLPRGLMIALPGSKQSDFLLRGRIDLLVIDPGARARPASAPGDYSRCACWVIDFKTGAAEKLSVKNIEKGKGIQAVLYALALRACGAESTSLSLIMPDSAAEPQIDLDEALGVATLFHALEYFHRQGIFGMRPDAENEYGYSPAYPMATRRVEREILEAKWVLAQGVVAAPNDREESA
jgi:hypothetical protein